MAAVVVVVLGMEVMAAVVKKNVDFPCQKEPIFVKIEEALLMAL